jgi:hypothetical protein
VRTRSAPQALSNTIQEQLRQARACPSPDVRSMDEVVALSTSRQKFNMWVMTVFGACALLLAGIGIYGLMAYSVEQRRRRSASAWPWARRRRRSGTWSSGRGWCSRWPASRSASRPRSGSRG